VSGERFDAFVSYGRGDADWVHTLAENLERLGLQVFLDDWELVAGDLLAVKLQEGLAAADAVVLVVSARSAALGTFLDDKGVAVVMAMTARTDEGGR
jgi:hypothetical protein